jgi:hypothetical protein
MTYLDAIGLDGNEAVDIVSSSSKISGWRGKIRGAPGQMAG